MTRGAQIALGLIAIGCTRPTSPEPAWAPQPPPPYPESGGESEPAPAPPAESKAAPPPATDSQSPLARQFGGHPALEAFSGKATYYADSLAGNRTASGERYDPKLHSAAHRKLPFGTVLRVVRQDTGATTYVRVNDRGPFAGRDRIIDLSRAAAEELEMLRAGVVPVRVEVITRPD